jgi:Lrp/AsnC family leucine-responsive transcriptional regulator
VNLSPSPSNSESSGWKEAGVIRQYVVLVDPDKIGLGLLAYVAVRLEKHSEGQANTRLPTASPRTDFAPTVMIWPEVVAYYAMSGEMDFLLRARGGHAPLLALHDGNAAAPSGGAGREI